MRVNVSMQFKIILKIIWNGSIWPIDGTLTGTGTQWSRPGSNVKWRVDSTVLPTSLKLEPNHHSDLGLLEIIRKVVTYPISVILAKSKWLPILKNGTWQIQPLQIKVDLRVMTMTPYTIRTQELEPHHLIQSVILMTSNLDYINKSLI